MSQVYRQMNDFAKARAALDRAKQLEPDNFEIRYSEVNLLEAEGRHAEAISTMKQLVDSTESRTYSPPERANRIRLLDGWGPLPSNQHYDPSRPSARCRNSIPTSGLALRARS
jgi:tetratricopeptide (TPR) repeat protein